MTEKKYNYIYDRLVDNPNDVHGILAYSVYKRQKIETIKIFMAENEEKALEDEDLDPFKKFSNSDSQLGFYKAEADGLIQVFFNDIIGEELSTLEKEYDSNIIELEKSYEKRLKNDIKNELSRFKTSYMAGVFQSIIGSFCFIILLGTITFTILLRGVLRGSQQSEQIRLESFGMPIHKGSSTPKWCIGFVQIRIVWRMWSLWRILFKRFWK